jgi:hypothetical protein
MNLPDESVTEHSNVTQDTTTYSSSADDKVAATTITVNETSTSSVPSSTMPNLEGVDYKQSMYMSHLLATFTKRENEINFENSTMTKLHLIICDSYSY